MIGLKKELGNTPLIKLANPKFNLYAKLECFNPTGSMKDRAAFNIINSALKNRIINKDTAIIESSSGNMGIALSNICLHLGLNFYCVIDPNITSTNKSILKSLKANLICVNKMDCYGGYLISRINAVENFLKNNPLSYWTNQYDNINHINAYEDLVKELINDLPKIDYIFLAVSSGGSSAGISKFIKQYDWNTKIICVDAMGSMVFKNEPKKRYIPGAGSSIRPNNLVHALIDDYIIVKEIDAIKKCLEKAEKGVLLGGSSALVLAGIEKYFSLHKQLFSAQTNVVAIFADSGDRYLDTIYNEEWRKIKFGLTTN